MRKRFRVMLLAAVVAAFIVPVGFALSLESGAATPHVRNGAVFAAPAARSVVSAPVTLSPRPVAGSSTSPTGSPIPEGAKLFAVGTVLFGLAAVVRRAV